MKKKTMLAVLLVAALSFTGCSANTDQTSANTNTVETKESTVETKESSIPETAVEENPNQIPPQTSAFPLPTAAEDAGIYVEPIPNLSDNFIRGMDVSSILVEEKSGVKYYSADGKEQDVFTTMAEAGVNYARIRVWNDPFDENGNGYGGGNNDLATAIALGKRATENGMKVCIDFHYSDFWADPSKQMCPKAWVDFSLEEKSNALYEFTKDSLTQLLENGVVAVRFKQPSHS